VGTREACSLNRAIANSIKILKSMIAHYNESGVDHVVLTESDVFASCDVDIDAELHLSMQFWKIVEEVKFRVLDLERTIRTIDAALFDCTSLSNQWEELRMRRHDRLKRLRQSAKDMHDRVFDGKWVPEHIRSKLEIVTIGL
jgi:hypothetical protein